jgi:DNA-binding HxlR family transcriptional regulator
MKGYGQFCPVAIAAEVFAERWTPLILRELLAGESRFNAIRRGVPLISRTLLARRLRELEDAGVVESRAIAGARGREYRLTTAGQEFQHLVDGLGAWGQRWSIGQFEVEHLDVGVLMWNIRRRIDPTRLPARRVVVRFEFHGVSAQCRKLRTWWLVLEPTDVDLCLKDRGFDVDLVVTADAATMARVWMGEVTLARAMQNGGIRLDGPRELIRAFPGWLLLSHYAEVERPSRAS